METRPEYHPFAMFFPMMKDADLHSLSGDIKRNGLREPIVLYEGKILDGRNRFEACLRAGVEPKTLPWDENEHGDPISFVLTRNVHRRHLSESQRAIAAAKAATMRQGARTDLASIEAKSSQPDAAAQLNVSRSSTQRANRVCKSGVQGLVDLVRDGLVAVGAASMVADLPVEELERLVADGPAAIKNKASLMREAAQQGRPAFATRNNLADTESMRAESAETFSGAVDAAPGECARDHGSATDGITSSEPTPGVEVPIIVAEPAWLPAGAVQRPGGSSGGGLNDQSVRQIMTQDAHLLELASCALLFRVTPYRLSIACQIMEQLRFDLLLVVPIAGRVVAAAEADPARDYVLLGVRGAVAKLDAPDLLRWLTGRRSVDPATPFEVRDLACRLSQGPILEVSWAATGAGGRRG